MIFTQNSNKMDEMNQVILQGFLKCNSELNNAQLSLTQKNNALNNLKLVITQSQIYYPTLKLENHSELGFNFFFSSKMKELSQNFDRFIKNNGNTFYCILWKEIQAYRKILKETTFESDLLEIKASTEKESQPLSQKENEQLLGRILAQTQNQYSKLIHEDQPLQKMLNTSSKNENRNPFSEYERIVQKNSSKGDIENAIQVPIHYKKTSDLIKSKEKKKDEKTLKRNSKRSSWEFCGIYFSSTVLNTIVFVPCLFNMI